jgi:glycosyltransferase involved in cell wall biosynthesis
VTGNPLTPPLSIVVPVFNEAGNLASLLEAISPVCTRLELDWELILVDDGSVDDSWQEIRALAAAHSHVSAVRFTRNFGKEAAIYAGLMYARGASIVVMDADLQHPPGLIAEMWALRCETGVDVISGVKRTRQKESLSRGMGARLFYWLFRRATDIDLALSTDFKLISSRVRNLYLSTPERYRFFRGMTRWFAFPERTIAFDPPVRKAAQVSRWSSQGLFSYAIGSLIAFSSLPIRALGWLGAGTFVFGFILGVQTLINKLNGRADEGFTTVILTVLIIGSFLMMGLSIIGGYVVEIFRQVQQRPNFIIREELQTGRAAAAPVSEDSLL